ncbi:hypothetical protein KTQ96_05690 [Prevotella copri]|uniref:Uncharacterized protein n=1 Tax=Segatella copri TaxID=165179 RepID=A0AAW4N496_9BACT|nr:hypothetical protein [Segatella copri]MBU9907430.1 hypothetical protein [Segatella copri]MBV3388104.1 hypothetical protein [Segatella copri]MBV3395930.1 hypothetical protein [Segatella copri]MBV3405581.1 hypothetical protein [Segatella copri]
MNNCIFIDFVNANHYRKLKEKYSDKIIGRWDRMSDVVSVLSCATKNVVILLPHTIIKNDVELWLLAFLKKLKEGNVWFVLNVGISGISESSASSDVVFDKDGYMARIRYVVSYQKIVS